MQIKVGLMLATSLALALAGCESNDDDNDAVTTVPTMASPAGETVDRDDAISQVVSAACARYQECSQLGLDSKFESLEDCTGDLRADLTDRWTESKCGGDYGVLKAKIAECADRYRGWHCDGNLVDFTKTQTGCGADDVTAVNLA